MKKTGIILIISVCLVCLIGLVTIIKGNTIQNPVKSESLVKEIVVDSIYEGGIKDLVFKESNGEFYYINRGLEQGLTIEGMKEKVLDKKVTLHLAKVMIGKPRHIAQLSLEKEVLFTEFN